MILKSADDARVIFRAFLQQEVSKLDLVYVTQSHLGNRNSQES